MRSLHILRMVSFSSSNPKNVLISSFGGFTALKINSNKPNDKGGAGGGERDNVFLTGTARNKFIVSLWDLDWDFKIPSPSNEYTTKRGSNSFASDN